MKTKTVDFSRIYRHLYLNKYYYKSYLNKSVYLLWYPHHCKKSLLLWWWPFSWNSSYGLIIIILLILSIYVHYITPGRISKALQPILQTLIHTSQFKQSKLIVYWQKTYQTVCSHHQIFYLTSDNYFNKKNVGKCCDPFGTHKKKVSANCGGGSRLFWYFFCQYQFFGLEQTIQFHWNLIWHSQWLLAIDGCSFLSLQCLYCTQIRP